MPQSYSSQLPSYITQYFWGDNLQDLDLEKNKKYITQTILDKGNIEAIKWLFSIVTKKTIKQALPTLKLSKKSDHFWKVYLS